MQESTVEIPTETIVWYGPHACEVCGVVIVKAAIEQGGEELEPPNILMRVFRMGAESGNPDIVYPLAWKKHVHGGSRGIK